MSNYPCRTLATRSLAQRQQDLSRRSPHYSAGPLLQLVPKRVDAASSRKTLELLQYAECRWPCGETADGQHLFCAEPAIQNKHRNYCAAHYKIGVRHRN